MARGIFNPSNYEGVDRLAHIESYLALGYQQQSGTLTLNRAGGFAASQVFDLGQDIASAIVTATLTARTADGETFGTSPGNANVPAPSPTGSPDNIHFSSDATIASIYTTGADGLVAANDSVAIYVLVGRYLKISAAIAIVSGANPYAGMNNPTATLSLTVTYT